MKSSRQNKIVEIIRKYHVETQEELAEYLQKAGFVVTQATVSRDIRELKLTKVPTESGRSKYVVDADTLFAQSDYLSLHCPLTPETEQAVNARTLSLMKPTAVLINTARGGVTDESAVAAALNAGRLRGAGIDVLCEEPMRDDHPYLTAKNCYVTPHVAWGSIEARTRLIDIVADNLQAYQNGKPQNCVGAFKG